MRVILADSNDLVRAGLRAILSSVKKLEIVSEARNNQQLKDQIKNFGTDVVVLDYTSENFDIDVVHTILATNNTVKFLAITPLQSAQTLVDALRSGVMSYVKKDCDVQEIVDAVVETSKGNKFFCGKILETIQKASIDVNDIDFENFTCEPIMLSVRELEVIVLIADGLTNGQIAEQLFLSTHTINTHRKNIMSKLGVKNTAGIVMYAVKTGLVSPNKFLFASDVTNS